jgi:apolipoprotein N-acyltransferase
MDASGRRPFLAGLPWLVLGSASLLFMGGKWNIVVLTWIGSIFLVRYFRTRRSVGDVLLAIPFLLVAAHVFLTGLAEQVTLAFRVLIDAAFTLYLLVPCLVDSFLHGRIRNRFLASLVYPSALVVVQFLLSYVDALGTVITWTGGLFSQKPLIQLVSVTGVWGPSFLVGWLASTVNALWEERFDPAKVKAPVIAFTAVFVTVLAWGGARMAFFAPGPGTVKAGSVVVGLPVDNYFWTYLDLPEEQQIARKESFRAAALAVQDELFAASERIVPSGIRILAWGSGNAPVFAEDEAALTARLQEFARAHRVYFFPCLLVLGDDQGVDRTRVLAIRPDGTIAYTHYKGRNPNAGHFHGMSLETLDTPYGRIASPICYEMESHRLIRQAGRQRVDILIVPGDEPSRENAVVHTELSMFRGIENGASVLRTTLEGLTLGMDWQGRALSRLNYYLTPENRIVLTELPMKGVRTVYAVLGDWFAWACCALLACLAILGVGGRPRGRLPVTTGEDAGRGFRPRAEARGRD